MGYITIDEADIKALKKHGLVTRDDYLTKEGAGMLGRLKADKFYGRINTSCIKGTEILCRILERLLKEENFEALLSVMDETFKMAKLDEPIYMDFLAKNHELQMLYIKEYINFWRWCLVKCCE